MNRLYDAAIAHFTAKRSRSMANLEVYLSQPVGVGEHSDIVGEVISHVESIEHANGCIETLMGLNGTIVNTDSETCVSDLSGVVEPIA